jgi:hypothetical protein
VANRTKQALTDIHADPDTLQAQLQRRTEQAREKKLDENTVHHIHRYLAEHNWLARAYYHAREIYDEACKEAEQQNTAIPNINFVLLGQRAAERAAQKQAEQQGQQQIMGKVHPHQIQLPAQRLQNQFNEEYGIQGQMAQVVQM